MLDLSISDDAEDDLLNAYNWYQAKEHGLGEHFLSSVQDGLTLIRQHPEIFPVFIVECRRAFVHLFVISCAYLVIKTRSHVVDGPFIQEITIGVLSCGLLIALLGWLVAKLAVNGMRKLADAAGF